MYCTYAESKQELIHVLAGYVASTTSSLAFRAEALLLYRHPLIGLSRSQSRHHIVLRVDRTVDAYRYVSFACRFTIRHALF